VLEAKWCAAWERDRCYRAPELPQGEKFFNYDSGPFTNGALHMGHVRTYVLGDVTARFERARGRSVLYCTEWDAFGLPIELEAARLGQSPVELVARSIDVMSRQMRALGISYDWSRVRATCDPRYVRFTQWLFQRLWAGGLVERREAELPRCTHCETVLSRLQIENGKCWRCGFRVEPCRTTQWFVLTGSARDELLRGLDDLPGWSPQVRNLVRGLLHSRRGRVAEGDWPVSRQRSWGSPIPAVHCAGSCGTRPVPERELPVLLPDDLDWSLGGRALAAHPRFVAASCPDCGGPARRETDTLDCFFDDLWCFVSCLVDLDAPPGFDDPRVAAWMPVDRFHSGFDTVAYLHLHRFLARTLRRDGTWPVDEPIAGHVGHEMVLAGGRKMSKHLGNTVSPAALVRRHGADAVRVAVLWAAAPHTAIDWRPELLSRSMALLDGVYRLHESFAAHGGPAAERSTRPASRAALAIRRSTDHAAATIEKLVEDYRPHAAIEELSLLLRRITRFLRPRLAAARLEPADRAVVRGVLADSCVMLAPFAPHLAEELWHRLGGVGYVVQAHWPSSSLAVDETSPVPSRLGSPVA
jgi:leucyl-tRNA synthetase